MKWLGISMALVLLLSVPAVARCHHPPRPTPTPTPAPSNTGPFYVNGITGNDGMPGTLSAPFKTLTHAQIAARTGTVKTVYVEQGTYNIAMGLDFTVSDNIEKWLPYGGDVVTLDGEHAGTIAAVNVNGLTIEGFHIQNLAGSAGMTLHDGSGYVIRWNTWNNCSGACLSGGGVQQSLIDSNTFTNGVVNGSLGTVDLNYGSSGNTESHNLLQNIQNCGLTFEDGPTDPPINNNTLDRNVLINVDSSIVDCGALYIYDASHASTGNRITNNTVFGNGGLTNQTKTIYLDNLASNILVQGNICNQCGEWAIQYHGGDHNIVTNNIFDLSNGAQLGFYQFVSGATGMMGNTFTNNIIYSSGGWPASLWQVSAPSQTLPLDQNNLYFSATGAPVPNNGVVDTNPVIADPLFINAPADNYALNVGSPAFNTPVNFPILPTDQGPLPYSP